MWGREKVRSEGYYHWLFVSLCPLVQRRYRMQASVLWPFMSVNGQVVKCSLSIYVYTELLFPENHSRSFTINESHGMLTLLYMVLDLPARTFKTATLQFTNIKSGLRTLCLGDPYPIHPYPTCTTRLFLQNLGTTLKVNRPATRKKFEGNRHLAMSMYLWPVRNQNRDHFLMKLGFPHIITPHCINRPWSWSAWGLRSTVSRPNSKGPWQIIGKNIRSTVIISALYGAHFLLHRPSPRTKSVALPLANLGTLVWFQIIGKCQFWIKEHRWLHEGGCMSIPTCPALHHWFSQWPSVQRYWSAINDSKKQEVPDDWGSWTSEW